MVGVIFHIAFTFCYFILFDCMLVDLCLLFLFSCFSDSSSSSQESILTGLLFSDWSLNFIIFIMVLLHHIIIYYIIYYYNHPSNSIWSCVAFVILSHSCVIVFTIIYYPWARNVGKKPTVSFFFSSREIWKPVLIN